MVSADLVIDLVTILTLTFRLMRMHGHGAKSIVMDVFIKYPICELLALLVIYQTGNPSPVLLAIGFLGTAILSTSYWTVSTQRNGGPLLCIVIVFLLSFIVLLSGIRDFSIDAVVDVAAYVIRAFVPFALVAVAIGYALIFLLGIPRINPDYVTWERDREAFQNPNTRKGRISRLSNKAPSKFIRHRKPRHP